MNAKLWYFTPLDTLFFRDGTPFNAGEGGLSGVPSLFPPPATTLQGAIRTALAVGQGWSPDGNAALPSNLGTAEKLCNLELEGPYLWWEEEQEYYFPAPLLLASDKKGGYHRLLPGEQVETDKGRMRLPRFATRVDGAKILSDAWIRRDGLTAVLSGELPTAQDLKTSADFWKTEVRVGIERNRITRTAVDSKLYSTQHIRSKHGLQVVMRVKKVPEEWYQALPEVIPLGGESRMVRVEINPDRPLLPQMPLFTSEGSKIRYTATLITSYQCNDVCEARRIINLGMDFLPGKCVCACVGKIGQLGGWDLEHSCPRPLRPVIPAGSTWFYEVESEQAAELNRLHGYCPSPYGFGQIIIGRWEER